MDLSLGAKRSCDGKHLKGSRVPRQATLSVIPTTPVNRDSQLKTAGVEAAETQPREEVSEFRGAQTYSTPLAKSSLCYAKLYKPNQKWFGPTKNEETNAPNTSFASLFFSPGKNQGSFAGESELNSCTLQFS